jgi:hypothetical protein
MNTRHRCVAIVALWVLLLSGQAAAETRRALIISGASGGEKYAADMAQWRTTLRDALVSRHRFDPAQVHLLVDEAATEGTRATATAVKSTLSRLRSEASADDFLLVVLFGHGTFDGDVAKFNLVGPDLTAAEWQQALAGIAGRIAVVNTTESSFPFLDMLKARGRIVVTATNSAAQKYATVFPQYFVKAMNEASTDLDKNGRTSLLEVFEATSLAVAQHYEQRGLLTTERALLDDSGDGRGREQGAEGGDGALARTWQIDAEPQAASADPEVKALLQRQRTLEAEAEALKLRKESMPAAEWQSAYESLMLDLARVSLELRKRG